MPFVITWLDLEINILSEVRERLIYDIIYMWSLITILYKLTYVQNINRFTGLKIKLFFFLFRATHTAHGSFQSRGLHHSHSSAGSKLCVQSTPQLTAMPNPLPTEEGQGLNPHPHGYQQDSFPLCHNGNFSKSKLIITKGENWGQGWAGTNEGFGIDTYTPQYIKQITKKDLRYSKGKSKSCTNLYGKII